MRAYGKQALFLTALCFILISGCSGMMNSSGSASSSASGEAYYYAEFEDIPIPSELSGIEETTIITTPGGVKSGFQVFKGRAEVGSLNSAMLGYMRRDGWELRSSTRGARSLMLFEKEDRYATIYILDGMFNTEMQVYVSPKLSDGGRARPAGSFDSQYMNN